ncbi:MAG: hypothetical protein KAY24_12185 [Candidatus Eisenbacteria sp.]|nr:hypothetical protein [Candidatus Eisenbacteria bacterium]
MTATNGSKSRSLPDMSDEEIIESIAKRIVRMRMAVPAVFFLESTKPLSFLGSQLLVFLEPFVQTFLTVRNYERFTGMMEDRSNVEKLIRRMEVLDDETREEERQARAEEKRRKRAAKDKKQS